MPSQIKWYNIDPNLKQGYNRGPGYYYLREHGYYSKYSTHRDLIMRNGPMKVGRGKYKQASDYDDYKHSPSYPTNLKSYKHKRRPVTLKRLRKINMLSKRRIHREKKR